MAAHARDVNIFIWTSRKSVDHGTNDRVMVHGDGTRADGLSSRYGAKSSQNVGSRDRRPAPSIFGSRSNVVVAQPGYLARPPTKAPETQIYFINHRSGANSVPRVRTVVRGERASRSIVNRTTALWSIWMVASLILADLGSGPIYMKTQGSEDAESRGSNGISNITQSRRGESRRRVPLGIRKGQAPRRARVLRLGRRQGPGLQEPVER